MPTVTRARCSKKLHNTALRHWLASSTVNALSGGFWAQACPSRPALRRAQALFGSLAALMFVAMTAGLMFTATAWASSQPATSQQTVYFYTNILNAINNQTPLVVRPSIFVLFEDGSWYLSGLRWSGWGSGVAHAIGTSNSKKYCTAGSTCTTGYSQTPAQVTLSNPGPVLGHEVYRCYQLTTPSYPKSDQHECLGHLGNLYGFVAVSKRSTPTPTSAETSTKIGWLRTPSGNIDCQYAVSLNDVSQDYIWCGARGGLAPPEPPPAAGCGRDETYSGNVVYLAATGAARTVACLGDCGPLCEPASPVLPYGQTWDGGPVTCTSAYTGFTCRNKSGHGFFLSRQSWRLF